MAGAWNPEVLGRARHALRRACRLSPGRVRSHLYFVWSYLAPSSYAGWRRWELLHLSARSRDTVETAPAARSFDPRGTSEE